MAASSVAILSPTATPLKALLAHLFALPGALLAAWLLARAGLEAGLAHLAVAEGVLAYLISRHLRLPVWWQGINLAFLPLVVLFSGFDIPPAWYLAGLLALLATSFGALSSRVPLYLSSDKAMAEVAKRLPERPGARVIDLGCGTGGLLAYLARRRADAELHGIDAAPLSWLISRLRLRGAARIRLGSLWGVDLAGYDLVYAYLSPEPMARLWQKASREMRPGSLFISNTFAVPGVEPDEIVELNDLSRARLLIWRLR
jgi:hypothetical protein